MASALSFIAIFVTVNHVPLCWGVPRIVDLSHYQNEHSLTWPSNPAYNFTQLFRGFSKDFNFWFENNYFAMPEHMGTHVDAPVHTYKGRWKVDQIPLERLYGPGVVINVKDKAKTDRDYRVTLDDIRAWESKYGRIPQGAIVMMNSGWSSKYSNKTEAFGSQNLQDSKTFHFPSWHEETLQWLIDQRGINLVGVDTPSTDYGQSRNFPCHVLLGKENIPGAEHVANLDKVPESGSIMYVPVLKLSDGSGSPARIFATFDDNPPENGAFITHGSLYLSCYFLLLIMYMNFYFL